MTASDHLRGLSGGIMVCGTTSDAGKSFLVAGLCRLLARHGVRVAPFKSQNMANNAVVTADGAEIGHAQWLQAIAAGIEPSRAMNPVLLKPTSQRTSQVVVNGRPMGELTAESYHEAKAELRPLVLASLAELRASYDVVVCEGAGSPAEINLLDRDIVNLWLAEAANLPALVVGDIDRGGVFAALYGTVALLPEPLRDKVRGFVVNKFRGDPSLLGSACADLEARCGVPTLGVVPLLPGPDLDGEDSLTLDNQASTGAWHDGSGWLGQPSIDVAVVRWPMVSNAGDLDPLRVEPGVNVRWVRSPSELGRPDLVVLPGSKATRSDLEWFRRTGLVQAVRTSGAPVVAICAGLQMCGEAIYDPGGVEGPPGSVEGLGWLPVVTTFEGDKILDRPTGGCTDGPGQGTAIAGYRIHHGRVEPAGRHNGVDAGRWLRADDGTVLGWHLGLGQAAPDPDNPPVCGTTLHALFEQDDFRTAVMSWVAGRAGKPWEPSGASFAGARVARLDTIADALESHLDLDRLARLVAEAGTPDGV